MAVYTINYTDPLKPGFTLAQEVFDGPGSPTPKSTLRLYGRSALNWGEGFDENFLRITETFAGATPPLFPLEGQQWYSIRLYWKNTTGSTWFRWNYGTSTWDNITTSVTAAAVAPATPTIGDYWENTSSGLLYRWDSAYQQAPASWLLRYSVSESVNPTVLNKPLARLLTWDGLTWTEVTVGKYFALDNITNPGWGSNCNEVQISTDIAVGSYLTTSPDGLFLTSGAYYDGVNWKRTGANPVGVIDMSSASTSYYVSETGTIGSIAILRTLSTTNGSLDNPVRFNLNGPITNASVANTNVYISAEKNGFPRFAVVLADGVLESGANAGSNLGINRYSDAGIYIDTPFQLNRATGNVAIGNSSTTTRLTVGVPSAASTEGALIEANSAGFLRILPRSTAGSFNPLVSLDDTTIIFSNGTVNNGTLTIAPWTTVNPYGLKLKANGSHELSGNLTSTNGFVNITGPLRGLISTLTFGNPITIDLATSSNFTVTLTGNTTLNNPLNLVSGQCGIIYLVQDGTGSRTVSYQSLWKFPGGIVPIASTALNSIDMLVYEVRDGGHISASLIKDFK